MKKNKQRRTVARGKNTGNVETETLPVIPIPEVEISDADYLIRLKPNAWRYDGSIHTMAARTYRTHRRTLVAQLYLTGKYTVRSISVYIKKHYGIHISFNTIACDLRELREQWQANAMRSTNAIVMRELAKLDETEDLLIQSLQADTIEVTDYVSQHLRIAKRRSALLGLDKAIKIDLNERPTSDLSDEELEHIAVGGVKSEEL